MQRQFGDFFVDIWRSASDFRFYRYVATLPFGIAFRHLLKISLLFATVLAAIMILQVIFFNGVLTWCRDNLPVVNIRDGEASAEVEQPYSIERKVDDKVVFVVIIDTTGHTQQIDQGQRSGVLVKKNGVVFKLSDRTIEQEFPQGEEVTIDKAYFNKLIVGRMRLALYTAAIYGIVLVLLSAQSAAIALIGQALAVIRGLRYTFLQVLKISFYSIALAVCFLLIVVLAGIRLEPVYILAIYAFIHITFLVGAILSSGGSELVT
jgi:hypothetical protein